MYITLIMLALSGLATLIAGLATADDLARAVSRIIIAGLVTIIYICNTSGQIDKVAQTQMESKTVETIKRAKRADVAALVADLQDLARANSLAIQATRN